MRSLTLKLQSARLLRHIAACRKQDSIYTFWLYARHADGVTLEDARESDAAGVCLAVKGWATGRGERKEKAMQHLPGHVVWEIDL